MSVFLRVFLVAVFLVLCCWSCAKLPSPALEEDDTPSIKLSTVKSIPLEWGNLISVSNCDKYKKWVQLWFQDKDGNIRMVPYDVSINRFSTTFKLISRK